MAERLPSRIINLKILHEYESFILYLKRILHQNEQPHKVQMMIEKIIKRHHALACTIAQAITSIYIYLRIA